MIMVRCVKLFVGAISRVLKDDLPLPDLIVIDGGKGHMEAASEIIEDELGLSIPIAGLAKDDKHQTAQLLYGNPIDMIPLKRTSEAFYLLQRIQDEVHRFAITFHRKRRETNSLTSTLDGLPGVGPKRKKHVVETFWLCEKNSRLHRLLNCKRPGCLQLLRKKFNSILRDEALREEK